MKYEKRTFISGLIGGIGATICTILTGSLIKDIIKAFKSI